MADVGRPPVIDEFVVSKLETGFAKGFNISEACLFAGISRTTYYEYIKENPEFANKVEHLQDNVKMHAKSNIEEAIREKKDIDTSKWFLERKSRAEFSTKQELEHSGGLSINIVSYGENDHINNPLQLDTDGLASTNPTEQS
jgi:predicted DNA-binding transcriptional regulator AlpA